MTDARIDAETSARVASIVADVDAHPQIERTFQDFISWAAETGAVSNRFLHFLRGRDDFAGATPLAYQRLTAIGATDWFRALPNRTRLAIGTQMLGRKAMKAYLRWFAIIVGAEAI